MGGLIGQGGVIGAGIVAPERREDRGGDRARRVAGNPGGVDRRRDDPGNERAAG